MIKKIVALESELESSRQEIERLKAEQEILVWNLGGCLTYAEGHGIDKDHNKEMACPALDAVLKMARELEAERQSTRDLVLALEQVEKTDPLMINFLKEFVRGVLARHKAKESLSPEKP